MYYNTTQETGEALAKKRVKAKTQTEKVLEFFEQYPSTQFAPFQVHRNVGGSSLLTSTRRSISDLTKEGKLVKCTEKRLGEYGAMNYTWRLAFKTTLF